MTPKNDDSNLLLYLFLLLGLFMAGAMIGAALQTAVLKVEGG